MASRNVNAGIEKNDPDSIDAAFEQYNSGGIDHTSAHYFAFAGAAWLSLMALPLVFFPRFLALLLGPPLTDDNQAGETLRTLNGLESYLARLTGISFYTLAAILILQTGSIPLTASLSTDANGKTASAQSAPFRAPTCALATAFFALLAWSSWAVGMMFFAFGGAGMTAWGFYVVLFGNDSQTHGKTSSMPFKNEAAKDKKAL